MLAWRVTVRAVSSDWRNRCCARVASAGEEAQTFPEELRDVASRSQALWLAGLCRAGVGLCLAFVPML